MRLRPAAETDLEALAGVQARAMVASDYYDESRNEEAEFERLHPRVSGYFAGTYHPSHAQAERAIFVGEEEGEIIGFIAGHRSTRMGCNGELQWMFVLPEWQRQGMGGRLLELLARWFREQGCTRVIVDAPPENPSRAFYLKYGAVTLDDYWLHWPDIDQAIS